MNKKIILLIALLGVAVSTAYAADPANVMRSFTDVKKFKIDKNLMQRMDKLQLDELKRKDIIARLPFCPNNRFRFCFNPIQTQEADIDVDRSLFVHDKATLTAADFSLNKTLTQMASQVVGDVPGTTAVTIFKQLWDTQNPAPGQTGPNNPHCDGNVNDYPYDCRNEGQEAVGDTVAVQAKINSYAPIALINRLDLAHEGWRNCGEYRIIYGKQSGGGRNFIIFEAVLPNPKPGCREGCLQVAEFWKSLSAMSSASDRATALHQFFYDGLPGYRPVVHVDHYSSKGVGSSYGSSGSGQIRTNQFIQSPWTLKEFKTVLDCGGSFCSFHLMPTMVKVNPYKELWQDGLANEFAAHATSFQADVLGQIPNLANNSLMGIGYSVSLDHDAAQSVEHTANGIEKDDYHKYYNLGAGAFKTSFMLGSEAHMDAVGVMLDDQKIVSRAMTQNCAGCHQPGSFGLTTPGSIGTVTTPTGGTTDRWPSSLGFVHVGENENPPGIFPLSPALTDHFLPARKQFLLAQLNARRCSCRFCFKFPVRTRFERIEKIQLDIDKRFAPRIEKLTKEMQQARTRNARSSVQKKIDKLMQARDKELNKKLKTARVKLPTVSLKPQKQKLKAAKQARGDKKKERMLRQKEVLEILKKEPPRRTVTGSFRVH